MGSDQSNLIGNPSVDSKKKLSNSADDIPYTSYSVGRPIGDSPKKEGKKFQSSPQVRIKRVIPQDIVVVKEGDTRVKCAETDADLLALQDIPTFLPIMRGALNIPTTRDHHILDKLDGKQVLLLCLRYQEHMKQCAEAVTFDQNSLITRIKEIEFAIATLQNMLAERQKRFAKYAERLQGVHEVSACLTRVISCVRETAAVMEELNAALPAVERLERFEFAPHPPPGPPPDMTG